MDKHDDFFGHIISMIPHELYRGIEESQASNEKYYKHKKQALTLAEKKKLTKEKLKKVYRSFVGENVEEINDKSEDGVNDEDKKLNKSSNDSIKNKHNNFKNDNLIHEEVKSICSNKNETEIIHENVITNDNTMEELRKRLQDRILGLKQNRMSKNGTNNNNLLKRKDRESSNANNSNNYKKKKPDSLKIDNNDIATDLLISSTNNNSSKKRKDRDMPNESNRQNIENNIALDIEMNNIKNDSNINSSDGKPGTKMKRLKRMLDEANRKRERIETLKQSVNENDNKRANEAVWNDVIKNAAGENLNSFNIDTKKIKKAIKRREKSKEKSSVEWNERKNNLDSQKQLKVEKREENLKIKHSRGNIEKDNSHSDAKSSKLRPGFEGKTSNNFLNKNKTDKKLEKSIKK